ncbi:PAS domain-containing protein [Streptomyces lunaelactis]|uniref:response regulator n=1 Tax=Streptomyces lunaelactis TaxID=1535768 RepID=UPI00158491DC|nr:PAS domain-containing protein [Streptomyces lunaelactis]NUL30913.1 PAS domain-containing protein [Streptomyces lunaelactis]
MSSRPSRGAARLAAILDALPDGLVLVNANGTVVNANTIALELFESPGTALVGRGLLDLLPSFDSRLIPGSMRRPEAADERGRTKPARMVARRTDGSEFPVEVTSASLEDGREAYASSSGYTGDELLMLVVRDLSGTVDTEAELARSQRQTEMILRAASEGVVGTDTDGRVVLVNPAAAQILGFRASDLGGQELHPLILHSRGDGEPFPYEESPLADTLKSGRKHRVRGQVLWAKNGSKVAVDLTTAPVRDGDQLVGAVMTFTDRRPYEELAEQHAAELAEATERLTGELTETTERLTADIADKSERDAAEIEVRDERYEELAARHAQLTAVLGESLRGPLEELRAELGTLAADPAGQLWPEANQILHHLTAGYARMTTLVDNVLGYQRLDTGAEQLRKAKVLLDGVVAAGVEGAIELIGPGRAQFAVHAPPIEAEVDGVRLATALAHLVADVAGVDSTGKARVVPGGGYVDSTIVVAAAQRGDVVRIEVRGPFAGGDPVHEPIVRGIVRAHGGVLQTHEVPGMSGSAYVLEVPLGEGSGTVTAPPAAGPEGGALALPEQQTGGSPGTSGGGGRRRARRATTDAFLDSPVAIEDPVTAAQPTGRRRAQGAPGSPGSPAEEPQQERIPAQDSGEGRGSGSDGSGGTGRRRGRPSPAEQSAATVGAAGAAGAAGAVGALGAVAGTLEPTGGSVVTAAEGAASTGRAALGQAVPPQGVPVEPEGTGPSGRRARRGGEGGGMPELSAAPAAVPAAPVTVPSATSAAAASDGSPPAGRRARRALAAAPAAVESGRSAFALPPAEADRIAPVAPLPPTAGAADASPAGRHDAVRTEPGTDHHTPSQQHPVPTGRRRARKDAQPQPQPLPVQALEAHALEAPQTPEGAPQASGQPGWGGNGTSGTGLAALAATGHRLATDDSTGHHMATDDEGARGETVQDTGSVSLPLPLPAETPARPAPARAAQPLPPAQPLPAEAPVSADASQGRAFSVRTLGQGVPFSQQIAQQQNQTLGAGRRRKLATPPEGERPEPAARPHPQAAAQNGPRLSAAQSEGRSYAIGAPDEGAEGPEPLDGPGGAVEVANQPQPRPVDDELPPEPLDNPRRLLVWPAPDVSTQQALSDRGYRPVVVHSREEVAAQIAAFPAALFVDPLTGPITRTALQSLRQAAVAAEVPVLVTAGLGQATREAAYGADPAVLLKALAPRDSEQHPPRVLLIEEHEEIALALTATLERRGMQVARADADTDAVTLATQMRPNLVVMDLMQVRRRRAGIIDWLRANGQLNRTPLVVYTSAGLDRAELPRLSSGETVLFLAERSTSSDVQARIVDLLAKIGTN